MLDPLRSTRARSDRSSDRPFHLVQVDCPTGPPSGERPRVITRPLLRGVPPEDLPEVDGLPSGTEEAAVLLDLGGERVLLVATSALQTIPRGDGDQVLRDAVDTALRWRGEQERLRHHVQVAECFVEFARQLAAAASEAEVFRALTDCVIRSVGGYAAIVFARDPESGTFRALSDERLSLDLWSLSFPVPRQPVSEGILRAEDPRVQEAVDWSGLGPLFDEHQVRAIAHLPAGHDHVLCLLDRRAHRTIDSEDWRFLRILAVQAEAVLGRVRAFEEVRSLSLTDSLTGLANRRQMRVVLERSLAAARRGQPLSVILMDVDNFKSINDQLGHVAGDRVLCRVANRLRSMVRASDLVVRYGGDEFLVVLPDSDREGAQTLLDRIVESLEGEVAISAGVASYRTSTPTIEALVDLADQELLTTKHRRHPRSGPHPLPPGAEA